MKTGLTGKCLGLLALLLIGINTSQAAFWQVDSTASRLVSGSDSGVLSFIADDQALRDFLGQVPAETSGQSLEIELPMPDGSLSRYKIFESSIMQPGLAAKFPHIKSYVVQGIDQPGSSGRVDISQKGFRGMIDTVYGRVFFGPDSVDSTAYLSRTSESTSGSNPGFQCGVYDLETNQSSLRSFVHKSAVSNRISGSITAYRLAVSATPEYVTAVGGSLNAAMAEINTVINRVNQIYERDVGIRLFLVAENDLIIDINNEAGFTNDFGPLLLTENQDWIDTKIGSQNYDIGHIFSTGGGGVAQLQSVCSVVKAQGVTGLPNPADLMSDIFYIDFVSHEIGHQFGGNHTFNGSEEFCGPQRNGSTAFEPGSGSTIMGYAGICGGENLQTKSEATFHAGTIAEINAFVANSATGGSCATILATSPVNNDPVSANAGSDKIIPAGTTFSLVGSAIDLDGDILSYQWDQMDTGAATSAATFNSDQGDNPLFRSIEPQTNPERHFPSLTNQLGETAVNGQVLPTTTRTLNFRLTARDCKSGQTTDDVQLTVDTTSGPFVVLAPNTATTFAATSPPLVTWNTANTANPSLVNCQNVDIDLLTFSADKSTYAITSLLTGVPNTGTATVSMTDRANAQARFRVSCSDNVFYDISDADLNITGTLDFPTTGNTTALSSAAICGDSNAIGAPPGSTGLTGGGGGGSLNFGWLLVLLGLLMAQVRSARENSRYRITAYTQS